MNEQQAEDKSERTAAPKLEPQLSVQATYVPALVLLPASLLKLLRRTAKKAKSTTPLVPMTLKRKTRKIFAVPTPGKFVTPGAKTAKTTPIKIIFQHMP